MSQQNHNPQRFYSTTFRLCHVIFITFVEGKPCCSTAHFRVLFTWNSPLASTNLRNDKVLKFRSSRPCRCVFRILLYHPSREYNEMRSQGCEMAARPARGWKEKLLSLSLSLVLATHFSSPSTTRRSRVPGVVIYTDGPLQTNKELLCKRVVIIERHSHPIL